MGILCNNNLNIEFSSTITKCLERCSRKMQTSNKIYSNCIILLLIEYTEGEKPSNLDHQESDLKLLCPSHKAGCQPLAQSIRQSKFTVKALASCRVGYSALVLLPASAYFNFVASFVHKNAISNVNYHAFILPIFSRTKNNFTH